MEKLVRIKDQMAHSCRQYVTETGERKQFHTMGFMLSGGLDEFYAELTGEKARDCGPLDKSKMYDMEAYIKPRSYETKDGTVRYENVITIMRLRAI